MKLILKTLIFILIVTKTFANNIQMSNISVTNNPANNTTKLIHFDITWENSWRRSANPPSNWDGAWVFFKFKDNDGTWQPIRFTGTDITAPVGSAYEVGNNGAVTGIGMFIFRSANGTGTFSVTDFTAAITAYPGTYEVRGFALEMVHIPQGSFYVGDGAFINGLRDSNTGNSPYQVVSNAVTLGTAAGLLFDPTDTGASGGLGNYPKGYNSFWIMKHELTIGAYRDFLNTLTHVQQAAKFVGGNPDAAAGTNINVSPNSQLRIATPGVVASLTPAIVGANADNDLTFNESTDGEWDFINDLTWPEAAAYLDWSGLRVMTELEYEKACRGPLMPVLEEFAWGDASLATINYNFSNSNTNNEIITNASSVSGNAFLNVLGGGALARRVGIFATNVSTRVSSGASYYGVLDLTGGSYEQVVTLGNLAGRSYNGKHGDGLLTTLGHANENTWPGINGNTGVNTASGNYSGGTSGVRSDGGIMISKGGFTNSSTSGSNVSYRFVTANGTILFDSNSSSGYFSGRGVRDSSL